MSLAGAIRTGNVAELPSRRDEDWRWSDLRGLLRAIPPASPEGDASALAAGPFEGLADEEIVVLNGRWLSGRGAAVSIEAGASRTLALRFVSQASGTAHHGELTLTLAPGALLTRLESHEASGEAYVADSALDIRLGDGARLERIVLIDEAADAIAVLSADVGLSPRAALDQTVLTRGAKRQRCETRVRHPGGGASARLDGLYLVAGARQADLTSEVLHQGVDGSTVQLTKGAVQGQARGVFQGRIVVQAGADRTDARMGHHALILSERAEVDAKPELLIHADDVACAHGNTIGALDADALFYARQRGVSEAEARAMLTEAFLIEVVDRIAHEGARNVAREWVAAQLRDAS